MVHVYKNAAMVTTKILNSVHVISATNTVPNAMEEKSLSVLLVSMGTTQIIQR